MPDATIPRSSRPFRLAVLHWFPLEQFPPAFNLLNTFAETGRFELLCCTTSGGDAAPVFLDSHLQIRRTAFPQRKSNRWYRLWLFLRFPLMVFWNVVWFRPDAILYFEPQSAPGVYLYRLVRNCRLLVHYHEYREPSHFLDRGNALARLGVALERGFLHRRAEWISHTNAHRIELFLHDNPHVPPSMMHTMPNYPPASWMSVADSQRQCQQSGKALRLVYVGAVSIRDTWIQELLDWVCCHPEGTVTLDLYVSSCDVVTEDLLSKRAGTFIRVFRPGVSYDRLPELLPQYHVGLILYKGTTANYVWNAPNKLFEYLLCGLEVWYPREMRGIPPEVQRIGATRVVELDFRNLPKTYPRLTQPVTPNDFRAEITCTQATAPLSQHLLGLSMDSSVSTTENFSGKALT